MASTLFQGPGIIQYHHGKPLDSSIVITGSAGNQRSHPHAAGQAMRAPGKNTVAALHSDSMERFYMPVLTVKRPTAVGITTSQQQYMQNNDWKAGTNKDGGQHPPGSNHFVAFGRPTPPFECFQSRTPIAQRARNCSRAMSRPMTDIRTGFMRTMSKPTPGELDLKLHQEQQALDKLKSDLRRQKAPPDDPDKLDMADVMKHIDGMSSTHASPRPSRPRAAKRRVAHASLVSSTSFRVDSAATHQDRVDGNQKAEDTQKAISEYKHRLSALNAQIRSAKSRAKSAGMLHTHPSGQGDEGGMTMESLRLAPSNKDRTISFRLATLRPSTVVDDDVLSTKSYNLQSRLTTPRGTASATGRDVSSTNPTSRGRPTHFPDPIYIPYALLDDHVEGGSGTEEQGRVKLSMRSASNVTRETSLMSDMDPLNPHSIKAARCVLPSPPRPTIPPSNTPVSGLDSDIDDDDDVSIRTNWSPSCSRSSIDTVTSPLTHVTASSGASISRRLSASATSPVVHGTKADIVVPSISL